MTMIQTEVHDGVMVLELHHAVTNALSQELLHELAEILRTARDNPEARALVLASSNDKFFSIGLDIPSLFELNPQDFMAFYQAFNRTCLDLFTFPKPTLAALSGHAVAGGCILALCCDVRLIAEGHRLMGLNEIRLGVPVPYPADRILRHLLGARHARDMIYSGEFFGPEDALRMGLVDQIVPPDQLRTLAVEKAAALGSHSLEAFCAIKHNRVQPVTDQILAHLEERERLFVELWYAPETRKNLKQAMDKF
jgi:enoyl-CoA hydratase/carnithine racemase